MSEGDRLSGADAFAYLLENPSCDVLRYRGEQYLLPPGDSLPESVLGMAYQTTVLPNGETVIGRTQPLALLRGETAPAAAQTTRNEQGQTRELVAALLNPLESLGTRLERIEFLRAASAAASAVPDPETRARLMEPIIQDCVESAGLSAELGARVLGLDNETWDVLARSLHSIL